MKLSNEPLFLKMMGIKERDVLGRKCHEMISGIYIPNSK